jgi:DNA mismatch repair protein MSH6
MRRGAELKAGAKGKAPAKKKKADEGNDDDKPDKIVRRELQQVFTNGTIVDGNFLTTDESNHCVAIKVSLLVEESMDEGELTWFQEYSPDLSEPSSFGICILDASTGEFNLVAFEDDVCRTRLETMFRQIRPKELVHAKVSMTPLGTEPRLTSAGESDRHNYPDAS